MMRHIRRTYTVTVDVHNIVAYTLQQCTYVNAVCCIAAATNASKEAVQTKCLSCLTCVWCRGVVHQDLKLENLLLVDHDLM